MRSDVKTTKERRAKIRADLDDNVQAWSDLTVRDLLDDLEEALARIAAFDAHGTERIVP